MPLYEYQRPDGSRFEVFQSFTDEPLTKDPETGVAVRRVFHAPAVHFKGKGFYNTDYGTRKRQRELASQDDGGAGSGGGPSADGEPGGSGDSAGARDSNAPGADDARGGKRADTGSGAGSAGGAGLKSGPRRAADTKGRPSGARDRKPSGTPSAPANGKPPERRRSRREAAPAS